MNRIRKGDQVYVRTGKDRGKRGTVQKVLSDERVVVDGINMVKRHTKPNPQLGTPGGIIEKEASIHISNVALYNPVTQRPDRVGFKFLEDGRKVRCFKSNGEVVDA
jgi:large subunit ribosomal protein L24